MSVVPSQKFEFETDDLNVMHDLLNLMLPVWFSHGKRDFTCHTKVEALHGFDDGRIGFDSYKAVEIGDRAFVAKGHRWFGGVQTFTTIESPPYRTIDKVAADVLKANREDSTDPMYQWLAGLQGPYSTPSQRESYIYTMENARDYFMSAFTKGDKEKFRHECVMEPDFFDGSSAVGYRLTQQHNIVHASYCSILYGK